MKGAKSKVQIAPSDQTEVHHFREDIGAENIIKNREKEENFQRLLSSEQSGEKGLEMNLQKNKESQNKDGDVLQQLKGSASKSSYFNKRLHYISIFRKKIKQYSSYFKFTQTKKRFLDIIDDYSFDYNVFFYKNVFQHESSLVSRIWDLIQFVFLLVYIIYLPIRLAFDSLYNDDYYFIFFEVLPNITYDFVLNICWLISLSSDVSIWVKFIGLFRIIVLFKIIAEIEQTNSLRETYGNFFSLLKLGSFIFLCAHLACCCWYALAIYEQDVHSTLTWLQKDIDSYQGDASLNLKSQGYIAGMYYCIVSMTTIGYGDISPTTYRERVFAIIFCILSSFLFAFTMNSIGEIIKSFSLKDEEFKQQMAMLNVYMKKRNLSTELQVRVRKFYENQKIELSENNEQGSQMIDNLTPELREDVQKDIYTNLFKNIKFFSTNFSERLLSNLYKIVVEKQHGVDEKIFEEEDQADKLYVILKGEGILLQTLSIQLSQNILQKVQLILKNRHNLITLTEGEVLGQSEFFTQQPYQFSAKANRNTQFAVLNYAEFIKLVKENKNDHEKQCQIRDTLLLNSRVKDLQGVRCESCGDIDHIFSNCQMISLNDNQKKRVVESNKRKQLTRLDWSRRTASYQALLSRIQIEQRAKDLQEEIEFQQRIQQYAPKSPYLQQSESKNVNQAIELNDINKQTQVIELNGSKQASKIQGDSKKSTKVLDKMAESLKLIDNMGEISDLGDDELNDNVFNEFEDSGQQIRKRNLTNIQKEISNPLVNIQNLNKTTEEESVDKSNLFENVENKDIKDRRQSQHHYSFPIEEGQQLRQRTRLPKLSIRSNRLPTESIEIKNNLNKQYIPLVDLKKEAYEEFQKRNSIMRERTIINIEPDVSEPQLQDFEKNFDIMYLFSYYLTHNNYDLVLHDYNQSLQKNQLYQQLILKAKKKTMKFQSYSKKQLPHKRIPSSQKFYIMKQRNIKHSQYETPLLSPKQIEEQQPN